MPASDPSATMDVAAQFGMGVPDAGQDYGIYDVPDGVTMTMHDYFVEFDAFLTAKVWSKYAVSGPSTDRRFLVVFTKV